MKNLKNNLIEQHIPIANAEHLLMKKGVINHNIIFKITKPI